MSVVIPPYLKQGDTIAIAATARSISSEQIEAAKLFMEGKGFKIHIEPDLYLVENQFAGNEVHRAELFNRLLANEDIKAIWAARGGYGSARMVDLIDFSLLKKHPKWIAGFSDLTVLLNHIYQNCTMASLHSTMPVFMYQKEGKDYEEVTNAMESLANALHGKFSKFDLRENKSLHAKPFDGEIIGGNLSVLYSIMGSVSEVDWTGRILFLEDLDEYYYHIDRMLLALKRAGKLKGLKAILCGSFISLHDHVVPFGYTVEEILSYHCSEYGYPIIFDVNAGHHLENICLPFGVHADYKDGFLTFANP